MQQCALGKHITQRADPLLDALLKVHVLHRRHTKSDDALADDKANGIAGSLDAMIGQWRQLVVQDNDEQAQMHGVPPQMAPPPCALSPSRVTAQTWPELNCQQPQKSVCKCEPSGTFCIGQAGADPSARHLQAT